MLHYSVKVNNDRTNVKMLASRYFNTMCSRDSLFFYPTLYSFPLALSAQLDNRAPGNIKSRPNVGRMYGFTLNGRCPNLHLTNYSYQNP